VEGESFDLSAAGLRADSQELLTWLEVLAVKLADALPDQTEVKRARRLLSSAQPVQSVIVRLGSSVLSLYARGRGVECWQEREVGGISIKREPLSADAWVCALTDELRAAAEDSAQAREALARLLA
jgi:hypothetical protein